MNTVAAIDPRHAAGQRLRERVFRSATFIPRLWCSRCGRGGVVLVELPHFAHFS